MRILFLIATTLTILSFSQVFACDGCNFFDYTTINNRTNISLVYSYRYLQGYADLNSNPHMSFNNGMNPFSKVFHEPEETGLAAEKHANDYESYSGIQVRFNYNIKNKWIIGAIIPYEKNEVYYDIVYSVDVIKPAFDTTISVSGMGDPIILLDRLIIKGGIKFRHIIRPGFGLKLPLGRTMKNSDYDAVLLPGSGSLDFIFRLNYQLMYKDIGLSVLPNFRYNGTGVQNYIEGNGLNVTIEPFYVIKLNENTSLVPHAGWYMESRRQDISDGRIVALSGGRNHFYQFGLDLKIKNFSFINVYQKPFSQTPNGNQVLNVGRWNASAMWNF